MSSATSASPSPVPASASAPIDAPAKKATRTKTTKTAAAATKVKKTAAPKKKIAAAKPVSHPSWKDMIKECIVATGGRSGVSRIALKKFAEDQYNLDATPAHISQLNRAIASGVEGGVFVLPKGPSGCVKLAPKAPRDASKEVRVDLFPSCRYPLIHVARRMPSPHPRPPPAKRKPRPRRSWLASPRLLPLPNPPLRKPRRFVRVVVALFSRFDVSCRRWWVRRRRQQPRSQRRRPLLPSHAPRRRRSVLSSPLCASCFLTLRCRLLLDFHSCSTTLHYC
ncbi:hypothetical protein DFH08DRAFT_702488 [Mycena albidolilacea]|uniref:Histone H1 n=1 Tax=Mycena albidolilacea TaxID=1033008 RepID=A0AAD6ZXQ1_9AGAR|nr:hypothetical protein DFH08DRAFT_702488 [Mycena albidolilacea]